MAIVTRTCRIMGALLLGLAVLAQAQVTQAAKVDMSITHREGYVGSPLSIQIIINDAEQDTTPRMPDVPGLSIEGFQSSSSEGSGLEIGEDGIPRRTKFKQTTWTFLVTASVAGEYTIPSFQINVDGEILQTDPLALTFVKSEALDLLRVNVEANPSSIYLGESASLTLRIWIKPYQDTRYRLEAAQMWSLVSPKSNWGPFAKVVEEMYQNQQRPRGRVVEVPGVDDEESAPAYLYELHVDSWPDHVGSIDPSTIRIDMQYPLSVSRNRGIFRDGLSIDHAQAISASPANTTLEVMPLPTIGQPEWFSGAVGRFVFDVSASPVEVSVGEPITITMMVHDQGRRPANLNLLQAPKLYRMPELDNGFRVPREQLGGTIEGRTKLFTQTIRAENDSIREIPALPFSYFDPVSRTYETSWSRPVAIQVSPSANIDTQDVVSSSGPVRSTPEELRNVAGGILANYTGPDLLDDNSSRPDMTWLFLLLLPPVVVLCTATVHERRLRLQNDTGRARARGAARSARNHLTTATGVQAIAAALTRYVADRLDLPEGGLTRQDIADQLGTRAVPDDLASRVDQVLGECERHHFAGEVGADVEDLVNQGLACIEDLEGVKLK